MIQVAGQQLVRSHVELPVNTIQDRTCAKMLQAKDISPQRLPHSGFIRTNARVSPNSLIQVLYPFHFQPRVFKLFSRDPHVPWPINNIKMKYNEPAGNGLKC